jgi:hypothetical protein
MDIVNFDALKAQDRIIDPSQVDPEEDYFILGKYTNHYTTNSMKYTKYPVYAIKAGDVMGTLPAYKIYTALLNQSGSLPTSAPTAIVLENNLSGPIVWSYNTAGFYVGTLIGAFTANKTACIISGIYIGASQAIRKDNDTIHVFTNDTLGGVDNKLEETTLEIRIYN